MPVILAVALLVLLINELSYRQIVGTLRSGAAANDARFAALRCLQLLTDAETAQRGYLLTGRDAYLAPYQAARSELPQVLEPTLAHLATSGAGASAEQLRALVKSASSA
ncbi:MAG: CHASE3 domain-containing protein [Chitinophagaceae bacterium]|nr:CHASE3 domain-containing protein [Rubrivivax sp.]